MRKNLLAMALATAALPAGAAQIVFSSGVTLLNNGQVSDYVGQAGLLEERFAFNTSTSSCVQTRASAVKFSGLGPFSGAELVTGVHVGLALPPGTNTASLAAGVPVSDTSCYASVPDLENRASASSVSVDIGPAATSPIKYFGFYWGSLDPYNYITLVSRSVKGATTPILISGLSQSDGTILGSDLLALLGKPPGYNTYVSFRFGASENFQTVTFGSGDRAFEIDNLAYSVNDFLSTPPTGSTVFGVAPSVALAASARSALVVPEPAAGGMFAAALGLMSLARRRRA